MEEIVVKKEPEELVEDSKGDILMNKPRPTSADQEMPSTSAIKQEIKEELDDNYNFMNDNRMGVEKELKTTDEEDFYGAKQVKLKFEDEGSEESYYDYPDHVDESEYLTCNIKKEERDRDFSEEDDENEAILETKIEEKYHGVQFDDESRTNREVANKKILAKRDEFGKFKCNKCNYVTVKKNHFKTHLNIHDRRKYLKCHFCEYTALQAQTLNAHLISKHKSENKGENEIKITSKIHQCTKCSYLTVIKSHYDRHVQVCLKLKNDKCYKCNICHYRTVQKGHLTTHIKIHNQIKELKCLFCEYQSNRKSSVDNHILFKHSDLLNENNKNLITSKVHACQHCNFKTTHASDLKRHVKRKH
ncbi:unnamed protein product [Brassicogethes aeneus]|uniref:C2H2-type domain-containing protein n=1 Tax=Brassicogethes aeneus TaxID=1431903 RepID=A0A9P0BM62_BRAAE|nr:unnamed protein product [Brassicogethes aeneus]